MWSQDKEELLSDTNVHPGFKLLFKNTIPFSPLWHVWIHLFPWYFFQMAPLLSMIECHVPMNHCKGLGWLWFVSSSRETTAKKRLQSLCEEEPVASSGRPALSKQLPGHLLTLKPFSLAHSSWTMRNCSSVYHLWLQHIETLSFLTSLIYVNI